jgi:hypothetical protein
MAAVALALAFFATSPRARLNVMQMVWVCFFGAVLLRLRSRAAETGPADDSGSVWLLPAFAMTFAAAVWATALNYYFINDDFTLLLVVREPSMELISSFIRIGDGRIFYRPLTYITFAVDQLLWGMKPAGFHLTNILLHFGSVAALYQIVKQLDGRRSVAAMTAGIFAAMPIQVEAVAWMAGRFDVLATCLSAWSVAAYLGFRAKGGLGRYLAALALYALAATSKETAFIVPALLAAIEVLVFRSLPIRRLAGFAATGAFLFAFRWLALGGFGGYRSGGESSMMGLGWKTFEAFLLRGPSHLLLGFNWTQPPGMLLAIAPLAAALLMFLATAALITEQRRRILLAGFAWMILAMIPAHFLLFVGSGLSNSRIFCLPSMGMALALGQLVGALRGRRVRSLAYAALATLFSLGVIHNLGAWKWTSRIGEQTLDQVIRMEPSPPENVQFVVSNMPGDIRGVFFFGVGFGEALRLLYHRDDVRAYRVSAPPGDTPQIHLRWIGQPDELIRREPE